MVCAFPARNCQGREFRAAASGAPLSNPSIGPKVLHVSIDDEHSLSLRALYKQYRDVILLGCRIDQRSQISHRFEGLSARAPHKRVSGSLPGIKSVNPPVNRRSVPPKGMTVPPASYCALLSNPNGMPGASRDVADPSQETIGGLCPAFT